MHPFPAHRPLTFNISLPAYPGILSLIVFLSLDLYLIILIFVSLTPSHCAFPRFHHLVFSSRIRRELLLERLQLDASALTLQPSELFSKLFALLLPRVASQTLSLLPSDRLAFDLAGYCKHPLASAMLDTSQAAQLINKGVVFLPAAIPPHICDQLVREAAGLDGAMSDATTPTCHARRGWLHFDEARHSCDFRHLLSQPSHSHLSSFHSDSLHLDTRAPVSYLFPSLLSLCLSVSNSPPLSTLNLFLSCKRCAL